jgi:hypothetical protein
LEGNMSIKSMNVGGESDEVGNCADMRPTGETG